MTLTLELKPETEARLRFLAQEKGETVEILAARLLELSFSEDESKAVENADDFTDDDLKNYLVYHNTEGMTYPFKPNSKKEVEFLTSTAKSVLDEICRNGWRVWMISGRKPTMEEIEDGCERTHKIFELHGFYIPSRVEEQSSGFRFSLVGKATVIKPKILNNVPSLMTPGFKAKFALGVTHIKNVGHIHDLKKLMK